VTIRHVLTHTADFPVRSFSGQPRPWRRNHRRLCDSTLEVGWVPASDWVIRGVGWYALAEIVRRIDGRAYSQYVREEIFEPLGMRDTWLGMPLERHREYALNNESAMHFATVLMNRSLTTTTVG